MKPNLKFYQVYQQWHIKQKIKSLQLSTNVMCISFQYDHY
jgi:hypothetical protein